MNPAGELPALKNPGAWPGALAWIDAWDYHAEKQCCPVIACTMIADQACWKAQRRQFGGALNFWAWLGLVPRG